MGNQIWNSIIWLVKEITGVNPSQVFSLPIQHCFWTAELQQGWLADPFTVSHQLQNMSFQFSCAQCKSEQLRCLGVVKQKSVQICVESRPVNEKIGTKFTVQPPGDVSGSKFSAAYVMRCAYPVCPNIQARIFLQHPPTIDIHPELSSDANKSPAQLSCLLQKSVRYLSQYYKDNATVHWVSWSE